MTELLTVERGVFENRWATYEDTVKEIAAIAVEVDFVPQIEVQRKPKVKRLDVLWIRDTLGRFKTGGRKQTEFLFAPIEPEPAESDLKQIAKTFGMSLIACYTAGMVAFVIFPFGMAIVIWAVMLGLIGFDTYRDLA